MSSRTHKGMGGFAAMQPHIGFAEYEAPRQRMGAQKRFGRQAKQAVEDAEWPRVLIGRKIDMKNGGNVWKKPLETLDVRVRKLGRAMAVSELMLCYVTTDDMKTMLSERYDRSGGGQPNSWRRQRVSELCEELNIRFRDYADQQIDAENKCDDESSYDRDFWLPTRFQVAAPDVMDARRIGLRVVDPQRVVADERRVFLETCRSQGFNISGLHDRGPMLEIVHTHAQVRLHGSQLDMPVYPSTVPLQAPHAYWDTKQEH